jgi:hypothetical protein
MASRSPSADGPSPKAASFSRKPASTSSEIGGRQRVLGGQAPMAPAGCFVGGLEGVEFGDQPIPQDCRVIGS